MNPHQDAASLVDVLHSRADHQPDRTAFLFLQDGEAVTASLTYETDPRQARAIAAHLQSMEPPVGQALLLYPSGLEFIAALWGCLYAGVAAVPMQPPRPKQSLARLQAIVADAQVTLALTTAAQLGNLKR